MHNSVSKSCQSQRASCKHYSAWFFRPRRQTTGPMPPPVGLNGDLLPQLRKCDSLSLKTILSKNQVQLPAIRTSFPTTSRTGLQQRRADALQGDNTRHKLVPGQRGLRVHVSRGETQQDAQG